MTLEFKAFACLLSVLAFINLACGSTSTGMTSSDNDGDGFTLTSQNRTATQALESDLRAPEGYKFVEVVVTKIVNPKRISIRFDVHYLPPNGEKVFLGTFSPFPADNPGTFIVPTQGKLKPGGELVLSLVLPGDVRDVEPLSAATKKMRLRRE